LHSEHHDDSGYHGGGSILAVVFFVFACFVGLIARVSTALFVRMLSVLTMHVAGLKTLVLAQGETLLIAHIVGSLLVFATLTLFALTSVVASHTGQLVGPALLQKMVDLAIISLSKLVMHLALRISSNFLKSTERNEALAQARVVDRLEILRKQLECLFAKFATRANVLRPVSPVEGHVKLFHGETRGRLLKVTLR
jgi:hypothetical protein